jgi:hypothetical protein
VLSADCSQEIGGDLSDPIDSSIERILIRARGPVKAAYFADELESRGPYVFACCGRVEFS